MCADLRLVKYALMVLAVIRLLSRCAIYSRRELAVAGNGGLMPRISQKNV